MIWRNDTTTIVNTEQGLLTFSNLLLEFKDAFEILATPRVLGVDMRDMTHIERQPITTLLGRVLEPTERAHESITLHGERMTTPTDTRRV